MGFRLCAPVLDQGAAGFTGAFMGFDEQRAKIEPIRFGKDPFKDIELGALDIHLDDGSGLAAAREGLVERNDIDGGPSPPARVK